MVIKTQQQLDYILVYPKSLLPEKILIEFDQPDFKGRNFYTPSVEGLQGTYELTIPA